jgi:hypothetical protein
MRIAGEMRINREVYRAVTVQKALSGLVGIKTTTNQEATMTRRNRHILKTLVLGVAVAAVAAPSAFGEPRGPGNPMIAPVSSSSMSPDDRSLNRATSSVEQQIGSDDRSFYRGSEPRPVTVSLSPDDRSLYRGAPTEFTPVSASPDDRPFDRGVPTESVPVNLTVSASDDFQWGDAGLGAGLALALIVLLGGGALLVRHQRQRIAAY